MPQIKLIACDVDGTLLNSRHEIAPRTAQALRQAIDGGVPLVLATGRARTHLAVQIIEQLQLDTPGIFLQGAVTHNADGSILHEHGFDTATLQDFIALSREADLSYLAYSGVDRLTPAMDQRLRDSERFRESPPVEIGSAENLLAGVTVSKIVIWEYPARMAEARAAVEAALGARVRVVATLPEHLQDSELPMPMELLLPFVSKGSALEELLMHDFEGILPENVLALGDAENDIELLQTAGVGVAMQNAMPKTKAVADYITTSCDADGVAVAVERYVLN